MMSQIISRIIAKLQQKSDKTGKTGFTLIELVMTMVVVGIISIPLSLMLTQNMTGLFQSDDKTMTLALARLNMEQAINTKASDLAAGTYVFSNYQGYNYQVTRTIVNLVGTDSATRTLKQFTVEVRRMGSTTVLVSLITRYARNIAFGP